MWAAPAVRTLLLLLTGAQEPEPPAEPAQSLVLENKGTPMRVEFRCTEEDIRLAGLSCTARDPCPLYLELSAVEPLGAKIFTTGNIHTSAVTLRSILLASEDAGKSWQEPHERIPGAILERIQFIDFETGWIGGQLVHPLPHDPFLLLTTDGGKSWRRRPVFDESRIGAIDRFLFDSRNSGTLWVDRSQSGETEALYERYESMTGGESWMIREVTSRPIAGGRPGAGAPDPVWRVRAEAATRSFRLEKRQGEKWLPVASFLIHIGECRPPEGLLPEPPQPPVEEPGPPSPVAPGPPAQPPTLKPKPR